MNFFKAFFGSIQFFGFDSNLFRTIQIFSYDSNFFGRFKPVSYHSKRFRTIRNLSVQFKTLFVPIKHFRRPDLFENNFEIFVWDEFLIIYFIKVLKTFPKNNTRINFEPNRTVKLSQSLDSFSDLSNWYLIEFMNQKGSSQLHQS